LSVAVVIRNFTTTGGAEKFAVEIAQRLLAREHRMSIYLPGRLTPMPPKACKSISSPSRWLSQVRLSHYRFTQAFSKRINPNAFDVVHCHEKGVACDVTTVHTFSYLHGFERFHG
jgi:hypothetical protein